MGRHKCIRPVQSSSSSSSRPPGLPGLPVLPTGGRQVSTGSDRFDVATGSTFRYPVHFRCALGPAVSAVDLMRRMNGERHRRGRRAPHSGFPVHLCQSPRAETFRHLVATCRHHRQYPQYRQIRHPALRCRCPILPAQAIRHPGFQSQVGLPQPGDLGVSDKSLHFPLKNTKRKLQCLKLIDAKKRLRSGSAKPLDADGAIPVTLGWAGGTRRTTNLNSDKNGLGSRTNCREPSFRDDHCHPWLLLAH